MYVVLVVITVGDWNFERSPVKLVGYSRRKVSYSALPQTGHVIVSVSIVFPQTRHSMATSDSQSGHVSAATLIDVSQDGHVTAGRPSDQGGNTFSSIVIAIFQVVGRPTRVRLYLSATYNRL